MADKPWWLGHTPEESFQLVMWEYEGSGSNQDIDLTRQEFDVLKVHLAAMRGYAFDGSLRARAEQIEEQVKSGPEHVISAGLDQITNALQIARYVFRHWPEMVIVKRDGIDDELETLHELAANTVPSPRKSIQRHASRSRS